MKLLIVLEHYYNSITRKKKKNYQDHVFQTENENKAKQMPNNISYPQDQLLRRSQV